MTDLPSKLPSNSKNWLGRIPHHPLLVTVFHFKICRLIIPPVCFLSNPPQSSPSFPFQLLRTTNPLLHDVSPHSDLRSAPLPKFRPQCITILTREQYIEHPQTKRLQDDTNHHPTSGIFRTTILFEWPKSEGPPASFNI